MDKRGPFQRDPGTAMARRARRHFETIAMLSELDRAEQRATPEQFATAARIAARIVSNARSRLR